jgi:neutral ceramidase
MRRLAPVRRLSCLLLGLAAACGGGDAPSTPDAAPVTTDHCSYAPVPSTAGAGGTVTAGALEAGAGEVVLGVPVGTALGGYTGRGRATGNASQVDARDPRISEGFNPSVGIETAPRAKALALTAGGETVVIIKVDSIFIYEGLLFDLEQRLGPEFSGKVLLAASHSHAAWMQFTGHDPLKAGGGDFRQAVYDAFLDGVEAAARAALDARQPARLGVFVDTSFDLDDAVNRDRRGENDVLPGGDRGDEHLAMLRVDTVAGEPIAVVPIFGEHGTLLDQDSPMASTEGTGAIERVLQEAIPGAVVLHLQGAGADTSPVGHGGYECDNRPGDPSHPCLPFAILEGHARKAQADLVAAWVAAGEAMSTELPLEMLTRSVELGPRHDTFTIRDGALAYAPFDLSRPADRVIYDDAGALVSPIDEFNAPVGAALCESATAMFPAGQMPGTEGLLTYGGCVRIDLAARVLGELLDLDLAIAADRPACQTTRTTVSALRIGDHVFSTIPGELSVLVADLVRERSPVAAANTHVIGYAQGHVGYVLRPEDWVLGGYEPSVTFWGPLEGEYLAEQSLALLDLAVTPEREDGAAGGVDRLATASTTDTFPVDDPPMGAGTVPETVDPALFMRLEPPAQAQPAATVPRVSGLATFVWYGDDPAVRMPVVTLERETAPDSGTYEPVRRRSGRPVTDGDFLLTHTPLPLQREDGDPFHAWAVEWQAVPWLGAEGLDELGDRAGVPLGRYRFHVAGAGWTLTSQPWTVVPGGLTAAVASRAGTSLTLAVTLSAPAGFRLLHEVVPSNLGVPLASQPVDVELLAGDTVVGTATGTTTAGGQVTIDDPAVAGATAARVTDRFANVATAAL